MTSKMSQFGTHKRWSTANKVTFKNSGDLFGGSESKAVMLPTEEGLFTEFS